MTIASLQTWLRSQHALAFLLPMRSQLQNVGLLVGGNILNIGLGIATSALLLRALGPSDVGRLTLALSVVGLMSIVGEFGLRDAAVNYIAHFLPTAPDKAAVVARTFLLSKAFLSALASSIGLISAGVIAAQFYPQVHVADLIRLGAFSLFTSGLLGFVLVVLEAQQSFAAISAITVLQAALRAVMVALLFATGNINLYALLALESLVPLAVFIYGLRFIPRSFLALRRPLLGHFGLLWHFTKWIALAAVASTIFLKLDVLMLGYYRAPGQVGLYVAALAIVGKLNVVKNAILTTAFPEACRRTEQDTLRGFVFQSLRVTALATVAFLPLFGIGGYLIEWLYGAAYIGAVPALYPLLAAFLIGLNAEPVAFVLYSLNRPRWIAAGDLIQLALNVLVNLALIPAFGIIGAALGVLVTRIAGALITFTLVRHFLWRTQSIR